MSGKDGIYIGTCTIGRPERSVDVFIAPEDFRGTFTAQLTFEEADTRVAALTDYHGHAGIRAQDQDYLNQCLQDTSYYKGQWFIPTEKMLELLYNAIKSGSVRSSFQMGEKDYYWTCLQIEQLDGTTSTACNRLSDNYDIVRSKSQKAHTRLFRVK